MEKTIQKELIPEGLSESEKIEYMKRYKINHDIPDLTKVTSKINTGLRRTTYNQKEKPNDELNKKYEQVQKLNNDKLKEYRDVLLKMKQEKRKNKK